MSHGTCLKEHVSKSYVKRTKASCRKESRHVHTWVTPETCAAQMNQVKQVDNLTHMSDARLMNNERGINKSSDVSHVSCSHMSHVSYSHMSHVSCSHTSCAPPHVPRVLWLVDTPHVRLDAHVMDYSCHAYKRDMLERVKDNYTRLKRVRQS